MFRLRVLGGFALEETSGVTTPPLPQRRAEAVLAILAVCGDLGCTRERLVALLWPESDESHSRHNLRDALRAIRHTLGPDAVLSAVDHLRLNPSVVSSDVQSLTQALASGRLADAVREYGGSLLEGFHVNHTVEFEHWLDGERTRLARQYAEALEQLATDAEHAGAWPEAAGWWARAEEQDPDNTNLALRHAEALVARGDRANAIKVADAHLRRLKRELGLEPEPDVIARIQRIRTAQTSRPRPQHGVPDPRTAPATAATPAGAAPDPAPTPGEGITPAGTAPLEPVRSRRRVTAVAVGAGVVGLMVTAVLVLRWVRAAPLNVVVSDITQVTNGPGVAFQPAISPDGGAVAYVAGGLVGASHVFVRTAADFATAAAVRLGDTADGSEWLPSWTPDGQRVRFLGCRLGHLWHGDCRWKAIGRLGGPAQALGQTSYTTVWSPGGTHLAYVRWDSIVMASVADTLERRIGYVRGVEDWGLNSPAWSPDGKWIVFADGNQSWQWSGNVFGSSLWLVSAAGGRAVQLAAADQLNTSPAWLDDRHLLFVSDRDGEHAVYLAEVGPHGLSGAPRIVPGIEEPHSISYSIPARRLAWARLTLHQNIRSYPLAGPTPASIRDGRPVTTGNQVVEAQDVSQDGRWIVYGADLRGRLHLYKIPARGGAPVPLTSGFDEEMPSWSPDGRQIAFNSYADGRTDPLVAVLPADGGAPVPLTSGPRASMYPRWSFDGLRIVFQSDREGQGGRFRSWIMSRDSVGGSWHAAVPVADSTLHCWDWAPDGALVCVGEGGGLVLLSARDGRILRRNLLAASGLSDVGVPRTSPDGRFIYVSATGKGGRAGIWAIPTAGGAPRLAVSFDDQAMAGSSWLSVGPDRLYVTVSEYQSDIWVATLKY